MDQFRFFSRFLFQRPIFLSLRWRYIDSACSDAPDCSAQTSDRSSRCKLKRKEYEKIYVKKFDMKI